MTDTNTTQEESVSALSTVQRGMLWSVVLPWQSIPDAQERL